MVLDKAALFKAMELKTEAVKLPEGEIILSQIGATDYLDTWEHGSVKDTGGGVNMAKFTALLIARCAVDSKGNRILADEDAEMLRNGATAVYLKLAAAARKLNGLAGDAGNSEPSQSEDLPSA